MNLDLPRCLIHNRTIGCHDLIPLSRRARTRDREAPGRRPRPAARRGVSSEDGPPPSVLPRARSAHPAFGQRSSWDREASHRCNVGATTMRHGAPRP
ncbi:Hypothetical protein A7982_03967 [Minicystis rosea]|nr:Hypothetical protein A7982_03967 [Minicystis rosea]